MLASSGMCVVGLTSLLRSRMDSAPGPSGLCLHASVSVTVELAGNRHSTNGSSDTPKQPKKRLRKAEAWKQNAAKKRAKGEEYQSPSTGKTVPGRSTGPLCSCKKRSFERITDEEKRQILEAFNGLANKDLQDAHLFGLVVSNAVKRRRPRAESAKTSRRASYTYHVSRAAFCIHPYFSAHFDYTGSC